MRMKQYQILIGLALVASAIVAAAFILKSDNGRFSGFPCGRDGNAALIIDTQTGNVKLGLP